MNAVLSGEIDPELQGLDDLGIVILDFVTLGIGQNGAVLRAKSLEQPVRETAGGDLYAPLSYVAIGVFFW